MMARGQANHGREPCRFHLRFGLIGIAAGAAIVAGLPGCGLIGHYSSGIAGLPPDGRWDQLPIGRWLMDPGVEVDGIAYCRAAVCEEPGFAARLRLNGAEAMLVRQIASKPEPLLTRRPEPSWRRIANHRREQNPGPTRVTRYALGNWRGAEVALFPRSANGKAAFAVVLARLDDGALVIAVAETTDAARRLAASAAQ